MDFIKKHKISFTYLAIFILSLIMYMFGEAGMIRGNEMSFSLIFFYILFPLFSFIGGFYQTPEKIIRLIIYPIFCFFLIITINNKWFGIIDTSLMRFSFFPAFCGCFFQMILWFNKNKTPKL